MRRKDLSLPLPSRDRLVILDRDATIISSREIAYGCFEEAFDKVISQVYPPAAKLSKEKYTREYHPFHRTGVYEVYYPGLNEGQLIQVGEVSWQYYLNNNQHDRFNLLIPGMDDFIRKLKAAGSLIIILTVSEGDGKWLTNYRIPVDGYFSMTRLQKDGVIEGKKPEAIRYILDQYGRSFPDVITIGDNPKDHIDEVISIGAAFGLGCPAARQELKESIDLYADRVETLYDFFAW
ncbi:MAG: HAD hydrolase-like protein [PVC group bacterium]